MTEWGDVPILQESDLSNKQNIDGPAIIESEFTTIVLSQNEPLTKTSEEMISSKMQENWDRNDAVRFRHRTRITGRGCEAHIPTACTAPRCWPCCLRWPAVW